jgi:hypothetical protein
MLTTGQVDHFRTFGLTVLRGYLADHVSTLRAEVDAAPVRAIDSGHGTIAKMTGQSVIISKRR